MTDGMIFPATVDDIPLVLSMVEHSRQLMRLRGNQVQWGDGYPGEEDMRQDIEQGIGNIIEQNGQKVGYFALLLIPEPTYQIIREGLWLDDSTPYGTVHRLCRSEQGRHIARIAFDWCENQTECLRVDTHRSNEVMLHILRQRGFTYCGVVTMTDGTPRDAFQRMGYPQVSPAIKEYVCQQILPRYLHFDTAHSMDHVQRVIAQSMELARYYPGLDKDMVYVIAAYHDTGIIEGREQHHIASGRIIREDTALLRWFDKEQVETMAQAAEDHRASSRNNPRSLYGMIVAEADRDIEPYNIVQRTVQYSLAHYPHLDFEGHWQRTVQHLNEKYAPNGYMRLFVPQSRNRKQLERLHSIMADEERLRELFEELMKCQP